MAAAKFMEVVTDDVLIEILIRFPDARSVIEKSLVCKRWHSLIFDEKHHNYFKYRFVEFHRKTPTLCETIFHCSNSRDEEADLRIHHRLPLSEQLEEASPCDLSFISTPDLVIRATCRDLVLLSRGWNKQFFVCNWLTNQFVTLPEFPKTHNRAFNRFVDICGSAGSWGYAIVINKKHSYRVYIIQDSTYFAGTHRLTVATFDSDAWEWCLPSWITSPFAGEDINYCTFFNLQVVLPAGGLLYWLDGVEKFYDVIVFDPFALKSRRIRLPSGFTNLVIYERRFKGRLSLGVVGGRLRLMQLLDEDNNADAFRFHLLVWELSDNNNNNSHDDPWVLVHDTILETRARVFLFLAFDPDDGDVLFFVKDKGIFRYVFGGGGGDSDKEWVSSFPCPFGDNLVAFQAHAAAYLSVLTVEHPSWPTPLSSLPPRIPDLASLSLSS